MIDLALLALDILSSARCSCFSKFVKDSLPTGLDDALNCHVLVWPLSLPFIEIVPLLGPIFKMLWSNEASMVVMLPILTG